MFWYHNCGFTRKLIQDRVFNMRNQAMDALVGLIADIKQARTAGKTDADLANLRKDRRFKRLLREHFNAVDS